MNTKPLVIYHANCTDGFCAAWVAHKALEDGTEYLPAQYGDPIPSADKLLGRSVFILDFSWKRPQLEEMAKHAGHITILDHHKTAEADLKGIEAELPDVQCIFDMGRSGARLAWDYWFGGRTIVPWPVLYAEDRDLWRWKLDDSKEINAVLRSYPQDFKAWDGLEGAYQSSTYWRELLIGGCAILRDQQRTIAEAVKNAVEIEEYGNKVLIVNATSNISEIAGELAKGRPFGVCYFVRYLGEGNGVECVISLRSEEGKGVDVSEIAKKHGGGGHRHAAAYTVKARLSEP